MDDFGLGDVRRGSLRRRIILGSISAAFIVGLGVYGYAYGFGSVGKFLRQTSAVISQTFSNVLNPENHFKLAAEIDLTRGGGGQGEAVSESNSSEQSGKPGEEILSAPAAAAQIPENKKAAGSGSSVTVKKSAAAGSETVSAATKSSEEKIIVSAPECDFAVKASPAHEVILNEIAWMGSPLRPGETAAQAAGNEWLELKNNSSATIDLAGWQILDDSEKFQIILAGGVASGKFYLLERTDDDSVLNVAADKIYSGALSNAGEQLRIFDENCKLADEIDALEGWPGGDNATKQTLERNNSDFGWHTSASPGGTPKAANSNPNPPATTSAATTTPVNQPPAVLSKYLVGVSLEGDGSGTVISDPTGISCGMDCGEEFSGGTKITLNASTSSESVFEGWSGACSGTGNCVFVVASTTSIIARFRSTAAPGDVYSPPPTGEGGVSVDHLVISVIQIAGASTTNDFVKIYNPINAAVDVSSWKLRKKTKLATDYTSVRVFPSGSTIPALGYFTWANSANGFSAAIGADTSSSEELTASSSIALFDASLNLVDAVAWGSGHTDPYVEGSPYPNSPAANQVLSRKFVGGLIVDTDNNAGDFSIQ
jgi:hypothetical protein